jgi:hypothetical protein
MDIITSMKIITTSINNLHTQNNWSGPKLAYLFPFQHKINCMNRFLLVAFVVVAFTACSRTSYPTDPIPPTDPRYPVPGESRYPNPYPSEDNSTAYPAEGQKDGVVTIIRKNDVNGENLPPGQAKKKYGSKSARVYAPGQRKKNGGVAGTPTVISVPDIYASKETTGQLYYLYRGRIYRKQSDGYYHLAKANEQNNEGQQRSKQKGKGKGKNQ